jgi:hypothetical protein
VLNKFCQPLARITASTVKNKKIEVAFVLSCEQDHSVCMPLIESGTCYEFALPKIFFCCFSISCNLGNKFCTIVSGLKVFDSELLLNGIVTQKLEFDRYMLLS